jgi:hypothetical protein
MNFLKNILKIPTLNDLIIKDNKLGKNGLNHLCEYIRDNRKLENLEFSGKNINLIYPVDVNLNDLEIMKLFKESLMKNENLKLINFNCK